MDILISLLGIISMIFPYLYIHTLNLSFHLSRTKILNPRLVYVNESLMCDNANTLKIYFYMHYGMAGSPLVIKNNQGKMIIPDVIKGTKETYLQCGNSSRYLIRLLNRGLFLMNGSTVEEINVKYVIPEFIFVCTGKYLSNIRIISTDNCHLYNFVLYRSLNEAILFIKPCNFSSHLVKYYCEGSDNGGKLVQKLFQYTSRDSYEIYLDYTWPFILVGDIISCYIKFKHSINQVEIQNYLLLIILNGIPLQKASVSSVRINSTKFKDEIVKVQYCCENWNISIFSCLKFRTIILIRKIMIHFSKDVKNLFLEEFISCYACALSTEHDVKTNIENVKCKAGDISLEGLYFQGKIMVEILINGQNILSMGPELQVMLPYYLISYDVAQIDLKLKCYIRKNYFNIVQGNISSKIVQKKGAFNKLYSECQSLIPNLFFRPAYTVFSSGEIISCLTKNMKCENQFIFHLELWRQGILIKQINNSQSIKLTDQFYGNFIDILCVAFNRQKRFTSSIRNKLQILSPPHETIFYKSNIVLTIDNLIICYSKAFPKPKYQWIFKERNPINTDNNILLTSLRTPSGTYSVLCSATNILGNEMIHLLFNMYNPNSRNNYKNLMFYVIIFTIEVMYFIFLLIIISLIFSESVYSVNTKRERRKPKNILSNSYYYDTEGDTYSNDFNDNFSTTLRLNTKCRASYSRPTIIHYKETKKRTVLSKTDVVIKKRQIPKNLENTNIKYFGDLLSRTKGNEFSEEGNFIREKITDDLLKLTCTHGN